MAAFAAAVDLGYRYLETDVHLTADGVVVAFHDDHLDRVTDMTGAISDRTWSEIKAARVGAGGDPIPLLEDILTSWPDVRVNIDPKHDRVVEPLAGVLCGGAGPSSRVCCGSFSDVRLAALREPARSRPVHVARPQGDGQARRRGRRGSRALPPRPVRPGSDPHQGPAAGDPALRSHRAQPRAPGPRVDDRRSGRDAPSCSTWASTAS